MDKRPVRRANNWARGGLNRYGTIPLFGVGRVARSEKSSSAAVVGTTAAPPPSPAGWSPAVRSVMVMPGPARSPSKTASRLPPPNIHPLRGLFQRPPSELRTFLWRNVEPETRIEFLCRDITTPDAFAGEAAEAAAAGATTAAEAVAAAAVGAGAAAAGETTAAAFASPVWSMTVILGSARRAVRTASRSPCRK